MLARNLSFVSWRPFRAGAMTWPLKREARIEPMVGLQSSHPIEPADLPHSFMVASKDLRSFTLMMLKRSALE